MISYLDLLKERPEALQFYELWQQMSHLVDDLVDEEKNPETIGKAFYYAKLVYTHPYFLRNISQLDCVDTNILNTYMDSVKLEQSKHTSISDVLRHCGIDMFTTIIRIEFGYDKMREFSLVARNECNVRNPA